LWATLVSGNQWMNYVGRLAFPIFAFLIAEGYSHTSNVKKYADPAHGVTLTVMQQDGTLTLTQSNTCRPDAAQQEGYHIGLLSIRRIAQQYGGTAETALEDGIFTITVTFSEF